ncbi:YozQ family protein [Aeribacillus pallidus]|jgi:Protein of unknown function (DUF4025)|uniref:YozQ family protein n=1 Tax=Aeribacillus TaxID=1055323 RepID=UPI001023274A|nr:MULTISPECIES: YozQ family protein [Aeribacillus]MDR9795112.1 YozQ family protein [Aeribacillus pallidus]MED1442995.1 YozQ family protein [Aeribacillus composti]RZI52087.1 DUF4025 domain-containing protein [Aeribacillus pallidus]
MSTKRQDKKMKNNPTFGAYDEPFKSGSESDLTQGLAITQEQIRDTYTEGTIDGMMEDVDGNNIPLKTEKE